MANSLNRLVSAQRVKTILKSYGADPTAWPDDERHAARSLLEREHELHSLRDQAMQLDAAIQTYRQSDIPDPEHITVLTERIMQTLPVQTVSPLRLSRHRQAFGWLMGMAASLVLVSLLFFTQQPIQDKALSQLTQTDEAVDIFDEWAWEDVTGEVVSTEINDSEIFPLYALVAQELTGEEVP